ncbi:response regulator [Oscillatoriales cyanobacterium LEGE 11467]|uniref:Response regulator n=1 Tax=Zarconia navalis LEGE 11467 TaxID=1828826 RepID=A0A928VY98_9CYAN|nr:response regulator [Zarconia navalis]MBE9040471.1 response regulator [Zarconia navalis LEGE 11467]
MEASPSDNLNREDDRLLFAEETEDRAAIQDYHERPWKVLIVDDEEEVHKITKLALKELTFENKPLRFLSAYSGKEAKQLIEAHPDMAIVLLDVVMETENSGLDVVEYIRNVLGNQMVRIILRTGQPGRLQENLIVLKYDINDYRTKTELTVQKLFTTVVTSLRTFSVLIGMI